MKRQWKFSFEPARFGADHPGEAPYYSVMFAVECDFCSPEGVVLRPTLMHGVRQESVEPDAGPSALEVADLLSEAANWLRANKEKFE